MIQAVPKPNISSRNTPSQTMPPVRLPSTAPPTGGNSRISSTPATAISSGTTTIDGLRTSSGNAVR